jgi:flagellar basal body P-ring protein FlgI
MNEILPGRLLDVIVEVMQDTGSLVSSQFAFTSLKTDEGFIYATRHI